MWMEERGMIEKVVRENLSLPPSTLYFQSNSLPPSSCYLLHKEQYNKHLLTGNGDVLKGYQETCVWKNVSTDAHDTTQLVLMPRKISPPALAIPENIFFHDLSLKIWYPKNMGKLIFVILAFPLYLPLKSLSLFKPHVFVAAQLLSSKQIILVNALSI